MAASVMDQSNVYATIGVSGIYDLEPMRHCYVNNLLQLDAEMATRYSPILNTTHFDKPLDLLVGEDELSEIQKQTVDFFKYRNSKGQVGTLQRLNGLNHFTILDELIRKDSQILKLVKEAAKR